MPYAFAIEPESFQAFENEEDLINRCKEWGLLSAKAAKAKEFFYKGNQVQASCRIVGFVDETTAVIEFDDGTKHCIHPAYLKEMQASSFNQKAAAPKEREQPGESDSQPAKRKSAAPAPESSDAKQPEPSSGAATSKPGTTAKKAEPAKPAAKKVALPETKVKMTAVVKAFTTVPNHFTEMDDEVVIYEDAAIVEPALELGAAWSSHSATLKKLELAVGDRLQFEAKVVARKLTRHPVPYKINNPSKIVKETH